MNDPELGQALPGLTFRLLRGKTDYALMVACTATARERDRIDSASPLEAHTLFDEDSLATGISPNAIIRFAEIDSKVVGYSHIEWWEEGPRRWVYRHRGLVAPEWRGHGIGTQQVRWAEEQLRESAVDHAHDVGPEYTTMVSSTEAEARTLILQEGYQCRWSLASMAVDTQAMRLMPSIPQGVEIRAARPEQYPAMHWAIQDAWQTKRFAFAENKNYYQQLLDGIMNAPDFDPTLCPVAWAGDEVVGVIVCYEYNSAGFIVDVAVRERWQRRGVGGALLQKVLNTLKERQIAQARLYVDIRNIEAMALYQRAGFAIIKEYGFYHKPFER